jgi:hypothetical protein
MDFHVFKQSISKCFAREDDKSFNTSIDIKSKRILEIIEFYETVFMLCEWLNEMCLSTYEFMFINQIKKSKEYKLQDLMYPNKYFMLRTVCWYDGLFFIILMRFICKGTLRGHIGIGDWGI